MFKLKSLITILLTIKIILLFICGNAQAQTHGVERIEIDGVTFKGRSPLELLGIFTEESSPEKEVKPIKEQATQTAKKNSSVIESPDGFYIIDENGVSRIKVVGQDGNGNYEYSIYTVVTSRKYSRFKVGELIGVGLWVPTSQQFYGQSLQKAAANARHCDDWVKPMWSSQYSITSYTVPQVWKSNGNYPEGRKSEPICVDRVIYADTCELHSCRKWSNESNSSKYLTKSKEEALRIYNVF
jgi:hypothetical protein